MLGLGLVLGLGFGQVFKELTLPRKVAIYPGSICVPNIEHLSHRARLQGFTNLFPYAC